MQYLNIISTHKMSLIIFCFSAASSDVDYAPSVFETAARREGRKSEGDALKRELEECDPDDPEFRAGAAPTGDDTDR